MIDIHTHLLPGVDDGSRSIEASVTILRQFAESGVDLVVCTPHLAASRAAEAPHARNNALLARLAAAAPASLRLLSGWEIKLDMPDTDLTDPRLALGGSSAILVEFHPYNLPPNTTRELARLRASGVVPVIAHPERYRPCGPALVAEWRRAGVVVQVDVPALVGSVRLRRSAEELLEHGLVDIFASDTHVDNRSLAAGRRWLSEIAPAEAVELLTSENARRLLANDVMVRVPPIRLRHGMLERLRELVFRSA
jgi:protein-tyrosine phosphatase